MDTEVLRVLQGPAQITPEYSKSADRQPFNLLEFTPQIGQRIDTNMRVAWDALRAQGSKFSIRDGKLYADENVLNGNVAVVDKIKNLVGGNVTIFLKDQRLATNVLKLDGSRAVGTTLAKTDADAAIFDRKASYHGEVQILGEPYMTAYDPILSTNGELLGILFVGIKNAEFLRSANVASTIAAAVEQQGAATQEISRNIQRAAEGTQQVSENIVDVQRGASETGNALNQVHSAASQLSTESDRLKIEVGKFMETVRRLIRRHRHALRQRPARISRAGRLRDGRVGRNELSCERPNAQNGRLLVVVPGRIATSRKFFHSIVTVFLTAPIADLPLLASSRRTIGGRIHSRSAAKIEDADRCATTFL